MHLEQNTLSWFKQLLACEDIGSTAKVLATALGETSGAVAAGVFLLDVDKSQLLLFGSWSVEGGGKQERLQSTPVNEQSDPLCFSLFNGSPYQANLPITATMALLGLKMNKFNVYAMPLKTRLSGSLGGILIANAPASPIRSPEDIQIIAMYAASLLENMILRKNESSIIADLRNDLVRLETQSKQERQLATTKIIGSSSSISHVRNLIVKAAPTTATVLITGETGTGKEATAEAIHFLSPRKDKPFVKINCGALSPQLLESELFGHVKGAFTGADSDYLGLLRSADGGSVLLDEIGDMPQELQVKFLRVLQDRKVRPVGSSKDYSVDIRIIAATNKDLQAAMKDGLFRSDLFHRIAALDIHIPPLRERRFDIFELAKHFFEHFCKAHNRNNLNLSQKTLIHLGSLALPGNARELANIIEKNILLSNNSQGYMAFVFSDESKIGQEDDVFHLNTKLKMYEAGLIKRCLNLNSGNITKAAEMLCIPRTTLSAKVKKLDLVHYLALESQS